MMGKLYAHLVNQSSQGGTYSKKNIICNHIEQPAAKEANRWIESYLQYKWQMTEYVVVVHCINMDLKTKFQDEAFTIIFLTSLLWTDM